MKISYYLNDLLLCLKNASQGEKQSFASVFGKFPNLDL